MEIDGQWDQEVFASGSGPGLIETGTKLYISNLDFGVSNEDIRVRFSGGSSAKNAQLDFSFCDSL